MSFPIEEYGFTEAHSVVGRTTIADLIPPSKKRCGIYLLTFSDGLFYIGQAVNVVRRFSQHRKRHDNISTVAFQAVPEEALDAVEKSLIQRAEREGRPITNRVYVSTIIGETDLDELISPEEQQQWLNTPSLFHHEPRQVNVTSQRLALQQTVPVPQRTEMSFWSLSCLPSTNRTTYPRYVAISINGMETFVIGHEVGRPDDYWALLNVAKSVLLSGSRMRKAALKIRYPWVSLNEKRKYKAGGPDQIYLSVTTDTAATRLLRDENVLAAARRLNLNLMRKGPTPLYAGNHCFDLADVILM